MSVCLLMLVPNINFSPTLLPWQTLSILLQSVLSLSLSTWLCPGCTAAQKCHASLQPSQACSLQVMRYGREYSPGLVRTAAQALLWASPRRRPSAKVLETVDRMAVAKQVDLGPLVRAQLFDRFQGMLARGCHDRCCPACLLTASSCDLSSAWRLRLLYTSW